MVSKMPRFRLMGAVSFAAIATLSGCGENPLIQKNSIFAPERITPAAFAESQGMDLQTLSVIHFDFDSDELTDEALDKIQAQANWIMRNSRLRFTVTGHTDRVGNPDYNYELGMRRAERVVEALIAAGVDTDQLVAQVSQGELDAKVDSDDRERANRRTMTEFLEEIPFRVSQRDDDDRRSDPDSDDESDPEVETIEDEGPEDPAPEGEAPEDEAPEDETPEDEAPEDESPEDEAPEDEAPEDEAPEDEAPEDEAPEDEAPEDEAPEDEGSNEDSGLGNPGNGKAVGGAGENPNGGDGWGGGSNGVSDAD